MCACVHTHTHGPLKYAYLCACVSIFIHVGEHMWSCVHMCANVWRGKRQLHVLPQALPSFPFEIRSLMSLEPTKLAKLVSQNTLQGPACLCLPNTEITRVYHYACFFFFPHGFWESSSCSASIYRLSYVPSPSTSILLQTTHLCLYM